MKDYFILGFKNLKRRGIRSWLTLLGIVIGIAAVISLISLGGALREAIISQFPFESRDILTINPGGLSQFGPIGTVGSELLRQSDVDAIERLGRIEFAFGRNIRNIEMEFNHVKATNFISTIPVGEKRRNFYEYLDVNIAQGRLLQDGENGVILGSRFTNSETNGFGREIRVGDRVKINGVDFNVVGILERKGSFIFDRGVLVNHDSLERVLNYGNDLDTIIARVRDTNEIKEATEDIERLMRQRRNVREGQENFQVSTPEASLAMINDVLLGVQVFIVIIASISILVGAIGVANTMATSVMERRKEIGVMKAIGARNEDIFYQFFIESGLMGFMGGVIGIIIGLGVGYLGVYSLQNFLGVSTKLVINYPLIIFSLIGSFAIGSISGIIPALKAARQNPVEALRD